MTLHFRAALVAAGLLAGAPAHAADVTITEGRAASGFQIGTLNCRAEASIGYLLGSSKDLSCEFRPAGGRYAVDAYMGRIGKIGVDIGATGPGVLNWAVVARSSDIGPGDLAGRYSGVSANAVALIGGGANVLVGGSNSTISLQPLSFEGQTGISIAAGLSSLTLDPI